MIIHHPILGPRDAQEFTYLGDANLMARPIVPVGGEDTLQEPFHDYLYMRDNPAGAHRELWYHEYGDRSWIVVTRDTTSHEIIKTELACDVAKAEGRSR